MSTTVRLKIVPVFIEHNELYIVMYTAHKNERNTENTSDLDTYGLGQCVRNEIKIINTHGVEFRHPENQSEQMMQQADPFLSKCHCSRSVLSSLCGPHVLVYVPDNIGAFS